MTLYEKLDSDIKDAMRAKDKEKLDVLRLLKSSAKDIFINEKKEITDEVLISVVVKSLKQRKDSIEGFQQGGRTELVEKEESAVKILSGYLPEQLSEADAKKIAEETLKNENISSKEQLSLAMKAVMPKLKGKIDGKLINKIVTECLK